MVDAIPAGGDAPLIEYPRRWSYKVIGRVEGEMREAIAGVVAGRDHTLEYSRASAKGNFVSLLLELVVENEGDRNAIFAALTEHAAVVMVI
ncbi:MAG: HP0495 family protein [Planctomycetota bacterium]|jgi:putative lipoic acid-binding regulatory protein